MATRDELVAVTAGRYARALRRERGLVLDEFTAVTGVKQRANLSRFQG